MKASVHAPSLVVAALAITWAPALLAADPIKLRASLDTSATHGRTIAIDDYLKQVQEASGGRIQTELFHSGQLFKDANVAKALRQGGIEMAVPGTWVLTGFVPDADIVQLPVFYGQSIDAVHRVIDVRHFRPPTRSGLVELAGRRYVEAAPCDTMEDRADQPGATRRGMDKGDGHLVDIDPR